MRSIIPASEPWRRIVLFTLPTLVLLTILSVNFFFMKTAGQQFTDLAQGILRGHLYMWRAHYGVNFDPVLYQHHQYWSEGVLPAIVLLPFVAIFNLFHESFYQQYVMWPLIVGSWLFVYRLARHFRYSGDDSFLLMFGFAAGSVFIGVSAFSSSWYFAQICTTFLLLWSLHDYFTRTRKRWWLLGTLCGLIFLTRATAAPIVIFFGLELVHTGRRSVLARFLPLISPLVGAVSLQALYNFFRFHSPLNGGYEYQLLGQAPAESRALGVFSYKHIPTNLYSLLLGTPQTVSQTATSWTLKFPFISRNIDGMSIFVNSPYLLSLFSRRRASFSRPVVNLLIAALCSCLAVLCFYGLGRDQLGYRYALDFLPELFVVFMITYRAERPHLSRNMKLLLLAAGAFNFYLLLGWISQLHT